MGSQPRLEILRFHQGNVRGVAFSPTDRHVFCSGAYDGKVNIYSARRCQLLGSHAVTTTSLSRDVNAVRFTTDGNKILATTAARRLVALDVETGGQILSYDNCCFSGRDRTGLAVASGAGPNVAVACCVNGRGLSVFDLREPSPPEFLNDLHGNTIRDVLFLHESWPWCRGQSALLTVSEDGTAKVTTVDGRTLQSIHVGTALHSAAVTPEPFDSMAEDGFRSLIMLGGDVLTTFVPHAGVQETMTDHGKHPLWKIRYNCNGSTLYTACDRGVVRKYRRFPGRHQFVEDLFRHHDDVEDIDISSYDEYLVTASKDRSVGVYRLGPPNHGGTEYAELT